MKKVIFTTIVGIIVLIFLNGLLAAQDAVNADWQHFAADFKSPGLKVTWDKAANIPRFIEGMKPIQTLLSSNTISKQNIPEIVFAFLKKYERLFKIPSAAVGLKKANYFQGKWYITLQTNFKEITIYDGKVGFTMDAEGNIMSYSSNYNPQMELNTIPAISKEEAIKIAKRYHNPAIRIPGYVQKASLYILSETGVEGGSNYRLIWHIFLASKVNRPDVDRVFIIDAQTGEKITDYYPHPEAISGNVQGEMYLVHSTDPVSTVPFEHLQVSVPGASTNTDLAGNYSLSPAAGNHTLTMKLEGPFVKVQSFNAATSTDQDISYTATVNNPGTHNHTWTALNSSPDDGDGLTVFWHANLLHDDYYQAVLGMNWTNPETGTNQMLYSVNRGSDNNAFAGSPITIYSDATARNCDVTYHETTHNILNGIFGGYIGWPNAYSEGYAFDEGFADYVACSFNNDSLYAENVHATRNCNNTMQYPGTSYSLEGHSGGQLINGVAWDMWNKEGMNHNATDVLIFNGLNQMATQVSPYYFSNPGHSNFLSSLLSSDDNNNNVSDGTPNDRQIFQAFRNHDLLPVDVFCKDSTSDIGNVPSPGYFWTSPDIWVRRNQDGMTAHENPIFGSPNYIYVRVRNLGYLQANSITVKVYWADPAGGIPWPADWNYIGETSVTNLLNDSDVVATAIPWTPSGTAIGHKCLLVRLECSQDMITEEGNVQNDNNLAQKNIEIVNFPPSFSGQALETEFFLNQYPETQMDLQIEARKLELVAGREVRAVAVEQIPFKVELKIPKMQSYQEQNDFIYRKNAGCFLQRLFNKKEHRFTLQGTKGKITNLKFINNKRALCKIKFVPAIAFKPGEQYEINVIQYAGKQIVGGLTYIVNIAEK